MTLGLRALQAIWFILPFVGITLVAEILVRLGVIVFNRVEGREEWQVAVASTLKDHVVIVGFGHNGYRVVAHVAAKDPRIVVIEQHPKDEHKPLLERYDIPLLEGDAKREDVLDKAGIVRARAIMALTDNDVVNLQVALRARELNPGIKVILRMFNEGLGRQIERAFGFEAVLSTTSLAAPSFAAALWNPKILHTISVGEAQLHLARFELTAPSPLIGLSIADVEAKHLVNVLLHKSAVKSDLLPSAQAKIASGDVVYVVGELHGIQAFDDLAGTTPLGRNSARLPHGAEVEAAVRAFQAQNAGSSG
jgi:Trk K+ transport system NAD-binding subunit